MNYGSDFRCAHRARAALRAISRYRLRRRRSCTFA